MTSSDMERSMTTVTSSFVCSRYFASCQGSEGVNCSGSEDVDSSPCESEEWYNVTSCECQTFPREEFGLLDPAGIVFLTIAILSALLDLGVFVVFVRYRHTPIVKAANRELSFLLLFVLMISFSFPVLHVGPVELWRCVLTTFQSPIITCVYAIFLVKTHRVLSIFEARLPKVVHRKWILGRSLQVVSVIVLTLVHAMISIVYVIIFPPGVQYTHDPALMVTYTECKSDGLINITNSVYPMLLTILSLCFAFKARRLPENYGESRHILATMTVCLLVVFTCFGVSQSLQSVTKIIVTNISLSFTPLAQLVLLFFPKVYIVLVRPERNTVQELRRMTLAHMQRQSEFSPTEGGGREGEGKGQSRNERPLKSLRSLGGKIHGAPFVSDTFQNGSAARAAGKARKKSVHILEDGTRGTENGLVRREAGEPHRGFSRSGEVTDVTAVANASVAAEGIGDANIPHRHRLRDGMRRQSSGLFVIHFIEETKENDSDNGPANCPVKFSLRETDSTGPGQGEGDMFVVSMLGQTLTLTVEDHKPGVPEILGGVYVGSKTGPSAGGTTKGSKEQSKQTPLLSKTIKGKSTEEINVLCQSSGNDVQLTKEDRKERDKLTNSPSPENSGNENKEHVLAIHSTMMCASKTETETATQALNKTQENSDLDSHADGIFDDTIQTKLTPVQVPSLQRNTSNSILQPGYEDKNSLAENTEKVTLVLSEDVSSRSCLDKGKEQETVLTEAEVPGKYHSLSAEVNSQNTAGEDAVSVSSLSSNSTFCETAADDKKKLLGENSRKMTEEFTKKVPWDESNQVDMNDICIQMGYV
ncbi:uncharacterized protein LOC110973927 [Acanthaster planci]|uniref:Uncharacterized protein LOC110973927 n=1 Tax=Acanthaster planci TaxID=133434 RepID=A0A8B7XL07_ACAPL|nr:uncharacterized protein LOC110973927 [Acanthaster planci]